MSTSDTITVDLGEFRQRVEERVESGKYGSVSEVVRPGLEALEREEEALVELWRAKTPAITGRFAPEHSDGRGFRSHRAEAR